MVEILLPLIALLLLALGHLGLLRFSRSLLPGQAWLRATVIVGALLAVAEAFIVIGSAEPGVYLLRHTPATFASYFCLAYAYFHAFNLSETGRRIRILLEIEKSGALSEGEILARYNAKEVLRRRLDRLERAGQIDIRDGRVYPQRKAMVRMGAIVLLLKWIVSGGSQGTLRL